MVFGDSTATGYGCTSADEVPGVLIARGLAEESGKRIRLSTKAIVGATSKGLSGQIDAMFVAGPPPRCRGRHDRRQRHHRRQRHRRSPRAGSAPRSAAAGQRRGRRRRHLPGLRRHHRDPAAAALGGAHARAAPGARAGRRRCAPRAASPVPFSDLLAPEFHKAPEVLFSPDMFHPSAAGYALAAKQLLPALCNALGEWTAIRPCEPALQPGSLDASAAAGAGRRASAGCGGGRPAYPRRSSHPRRARFSGVVTGSQPRSSHA